MWGLGQAWGPASGEEAAHPGAATTTTTLKKRCDPAKMFHARVHICTPKGWTRRTWTCPRDPSSGGWTTGACPSGAAGRSSRATRPSARAPGTSASSAMLWARWTISAATASAASSCSGGGRNRTFARTAASCSRREERGSWRGDGGEYGGIVVVVDMTELVDSVGLCYVLPHLITCLDREYAELNNTCLSFSLETPSQSIMRHVSMNAKKRSLFFYFLTRGANPSFINIQTLQ
ncbi:hypothetical protein F4779DRAFT_160971 [Xylariaceae sp. FL0662B]|nr:hypothetical protein F4779DRAFT_160971 [Xylariaceae sp. FL0662B]